MELYIYTGGRPPLQLGDSSFTEHLSLRAALALWGLHYSAKTLQQGFISPPSETRLMAGCAKVNLEHLNRML